MGVYQLIFMEKVPDNAVCNEAVKLAKAHSFGSLTGFVNGVLRSIARNKENLVYPERDKEPVKYLSITYSMPEWIVEMWMKRYGIDETEQILKGLLENRPVTIRMNTTDDEAKKLIAQLSAEGVSLKQTKELAYAYQIAEFDRIDKLTGFAEGKFMIQDLGSMMITEMAGIKKGDYIIDVCGAPGGKALHAAFLTGETGHVDVRDLSDNKVSLMEENIARSGCSNVTASVWDATVCHEESIGKADVVIADLPCSGLGVIGRKGDIKYRLKPDDITEISALQREILSVVQSYVKPDGVLMYSTCTLTAEENEQNVAWFCEHYPFQLMEDKTLLPGKQDNIQDETDGFYMARFKKGKI
jgi:16S rRNA (cytosine967-C5)-methyltransferase